MSQFSKYWAIPRAAKRIEFEGGGGGGGGG